LAGTHAVAAEEFARRRGMQKLCWPGSPILEWEDCAVTLLTLILTIVVVGVLLWLINTYVPMQSTVKSILNIVVIIILIIWILNAFDLIGPLNRPIR
jgi:hypothetical protein